MKLHEVKDPAAMRVFLEEDPLRLCSIINKLFYDTIWSQDEDFILYVDDPDAPKNWLLKGTKTPRRQQPIGTPPGIFPRGTGNLRKTLETVLSGRIARAPGFGIQDPVCEIRCPVSAGEVAAFSPGPLVGTWI